MQLDCVFTGSDPQNYNQEGMDVIEIDSESDDDVVVDEQIQVGPLTELEQMETNHDERGIGSNYPSRVNEKSVLPSSFHLSDRSNLSGSEDIPLKISNGRSSLPQPLRSVSMGARDNSILNLNSAKNKVRVGEELPHIGKRALFPSFDQKDGINAEASTSSSVFSAAGIHGIKDDTRVPQKLTAYGGNGVNGRFSSSISQDDFQASDRAGKVRVLPPSMHGRSLNERQLPGSGDPLNHFTQVDERIIDFDERLIFQEVLQNLNHPRVEDNLEEGLLTISLLKHQKLALGWMVKKESSTLCSGGILADDQGLGKTVSMIALIQKQLKMQLKFTSDDSDNAKSEALNLDEDDDVCALEETDKSKMVGHDIKRKSVASSSGSNMRPCAGTLVVCPASILRQWARELDEKVSESGRLSVLIYHGGSRTKDPSFLATHHVVLTTYTIVTNEVPKQPLVVDDEDEEEKGLDGISQEFSKKRRKKTSNRGRGKRKGKGSKGSDFYYNSGPLAKVRWFRVILDEAQTIKNYRTQVARACCGLRAKRRWCLSGTPIQNSVDDLYSYFRFLKYDPYAVYSSFCASIKHPISRDTSQGYKKLQAVLKNVLLRRTKGTLINGEPIIKLPPKKVVLTKVEFSPDERNFYRTLEADSKKQFKAYAAAGTLKQNYANILLLLLRLRQACDHPLLVKGFHSNTVCSEDVDIAKQLPREMQLNLLDKLEGSSAICGLCRDPPEDAVVTMCGHVFCYQCVSESLTGDDNVCPSPVCKELLGRDVVFSQVTLKSCVSGDFHASSSTNSYDEESQMVQSGSFVSSKIKAALEIIMSMTCNLEDNPEVTHIDDMEVSCPASHTADIPAKAIVFSQWTGMLDLLEIQLNQSLIQYRRLDGTMTLPSRDKAVKEFNTDPEVIVMLMSLKAGNLGLNMVAACHVILLDLWWNPTTEDQAVDRAHRIGQTREVTVCRLTVKDTVEDRILALQEEKRNMVNSAFGDDQGSTRGSRLTVDDLRYLFGMI